MSTYENIPEQRCRELLGRDSVGRLSFTTPAGPRLVPVAYLAGEHSVSFRTTEYSELATYAPGTEVCLEVDHLDPGHRAGWCISVRGTCRKEAAADASAGGADAAGPIDYVSRWAGSEQSVVLTLDWTALTGRRPVAG